MLQQILEDMVIEPEILAELSDEQKQLLFCKLREEQLRKWKLREDQFEHDEKHAVKMKVKLGARKVDFLIASDGNPWVWVMGEHTNDKTIEQTLEEEASARAKKKAEEEAEMLKQKEEEEQLRKEQEEEERLRKERLEREAQLQREAEAQRLADDQLQALKAMQMEETQHRLQQLKEKREKSRVVREQSYRDLKTKRMSEILSAIATTRATLLNGVSEDAKQLDKDWQQQEAKVKLMDEKRRAVARLAREEHRSNSVLMKVLLTQSVAKSWRENTALGLQLTAQKAISSVPNQSTGFPPPSASAVKKPLKPNGRDAAEKWYIEFEKPKGVGIDAKTGAVYDWFHGPIGRPVAENLLERTEVHSFLVRLSDKIWGYAISYRADNSFKHFLIDVSETGTYQFFGTSQREHDSLLSLVLWHKMRPVSTNGQELLLYPCGQSSCPADYSVILPEQVESTFL